MTPSWGRPLNVRVRSSESVLVTEPTLGIDASQPSVDAPLGSTPTSDNYIMREGGLEPRPMLALRGTPSQPLGAFPITGAFELIGVTNARYPLVSNATRWAIYGQSNNPNAWSVLSYVSAFGIDAPPTGASTDYWDLTQIYDAVSDDNIAVGALGSAQSLYCCKSDGTVFSTLTTAPRAKFVTAAENYLVAFNTNEDGNQFVQRVRWSDRGTPSNFTGGLSGFEDLLAAKGEGRRILYRDGRLILFFDGEIWQGVPSDFPFVWRFAPLDPSVGSPYSWSIADTPAGLMFLSKDFQVYLLPKGGGTAQAIGAKLHRTIRNTIDQAQRSFSVYDHTYSQYQFYYPYKGGTGRPQRAVFLDINDGSWAPQSFDSAGGGLALTRGCEIHINSAVTTWADLSAVTWGGLTQSWVDMGAPSEDRAILLGSSAGTLYSLSSTATTDNGVAVVSRWRSTGLVGADPAQQKTVSEFRVDYQGDSSSSLTVAFSRDLGNTFESGAGISLPSTSGMSQGVAYPYVASRYPQFEISSEAQRYRLFRMHTTYRRGGR